MAKKLSNTIRVTQKQPEEAFIANDGKFEPQ